ncbi:hypothetical protein MMC07_005220 [Pseudocyphellaria aurata]|nr:hypothetical protein [Pseudocyphellaria aurata]
MRNIFYPKHVAAYVSEEQLRELREREIPIERDFAFGKEKPETPMTTVAPKSELGDPEHVYHRLQLEPEQKPLVNVQVKPKQERLVNVQVQAINPQEASKIMSSLPEVLQFYRIPIPNPQLELSFDESSSLWNSTKIDGDTESVHRLQARPVPIYGSVSTADIAEQVKAVLHESEEGERIVLGAEDITILKSEDEESSEETDRLKMLGDFRVAIRVKNGETVKRLVRIRAQASS